MRLSLLLAGLVALLSQAVPLEAQIQGSQDFVTLPGDVDKASRIAGFGYGNQYYIAYNDNSNGLSGGEGPALYFSPVTASNATPPVLNFQDATKIRIPGVALDTHLCHMAAAVVDDAPYIFQFKCRRSGSHNLLSATYEKLIPPVGTNNTPSFNTLATVSSSLTSQVGNLFDVAAAPLRSKMYLFLMRSTASKPNSIMVWSYGGQGSGGPVAESSFSFAGTDSTLQALDATNVTLASGEQAIVVTATFVASGKAQVKVWLFDGKTTALNPVVLSNPPYAQFPASVRIAYGPAQGTAKINSCTLFYAAVDHGFFGVSSRIYQSQVALPSSLSGALSQSGGWNQLTGIWQNSRNGQFSQYPYAWTAFPVSVPSQTKTNSYANVYQYITLMECGLSSDPHAHHNSFVSSLALQLDVDPSTAGKQWNSGNWNNLSTADQKAAVQSWNLLGMITGLPPLPAGTTVNNRSPLVALSYNSTNSTQVSKTTIVSDGVSASLSELTASASYTYSTKQGAIQSNSLALTVALAFNASVQTNSYDAVADEGYLIVSQPIYETANYDVYAYDGTTPLGVATAAISTESTSFGAIPFYLDDPSRPYPGMPACIYQSFPVDSLGVPLVTYPEMTDIEGWKTPDTLTQVSLLFTNGTQQYFDCNDFSTTTFALTATQLNKISGQTANTVDLGAGVSFFGIDTEVNNSFTLKSQTSTTFSSSQTSQIYYPELQDLKGYTALRLHVLFYSLIDNPPSPPNWMPTIFTGAKPWLLSWKVDSSTPTGSTTTPHTTPPCVPPHHSGPRG